MILNKFALKRLVSYYCSRAENLQDALKDRPDDWGKFLCEFRDEVDNIFSRIMQFEKKCIAEGRIGDLERMKRFFVRYFRKHFHYGDLSKWSIDKPYGYAGDFNVIDNIYKNNPGTTGYDRLFDNYFLSSAISVGVRNRKDDFKRALLTFIESRPNEKLRIMNLASGPAREIRELLSEHPQIGKRVHFDCYDAEAEAHRYARKLMRGHRNVSFIRANAIRISLSRDASRYIGKEYDFIYSTGLFDYLSHDVSVKLIKNLRARLKDGGVLFISDVRDRYRNPSVCYMEWAGGWNLIYRTDEEFEEIFKQAGFDQNKLEKQYEQQGVMQYIRAVK